MNNNGEAQEIYMPLDTNGNLVVLDLFLNEKRCWDPKIQGFLYTEEFHFGSHTGSEIGFDRARRWLHDCLHAHQCGVSGTWQLPSRLLDVGENQIRLFETTAKGFKEPYVCLSHVWGGPENRRLISTVSTLRKHMQGIPWQDIPRTFQDAIQITQRMGVKYLWIDSLCILQEFPGMTVDERRATKADFTRENSAMASIYQNSFFTICAGTSTSMDSGIFSRWPIDCHKITVTGDNGKTAYLYIRGSPPRAHCSDHNLTIETRGWTFQEFLLPPRLLWFGPFDITWRCRASYKCECIRVGQNPRRRNLAGITATERFGGRWPIMKDSSLWWETVVNHYTGRTLTNDRDKLPALSGLAQIYHRITGDAYLAGLWKHSIHSNLCWFHAVNVEPVFTGNPWRLGTGRRPRAFRAPSWSWAAIDPLDNANANCCFWSGTELWLFPVKPHGTLRPVCEILDVYCPPKTNDPFGEVKEGSFLEIGAIVTSATITTAPKSKIWEGPGGKYSWTLEFLWHLENIEDGTRVEYCMPDCRLGEDDGLTEGSKVYCVPIREALTTAASERGCLVLKHLQGKEYQRVGFCILMNDNPHLNDEERMERQSNSFKETKLDLGSAEMKRWIQDYALPYQEVAASVIRIV